MKPFSIFYLNKTEKDNPPKTLIDFVKDLEYYYVKWGEGLRKEDIPEKAEHMYQMYLSAQECPMVLESVTIDSHNKEENIKKIRELANNSNFHSYVYCGEIITDVDIFIEKLLLEGLL